MSDYNCIDIEFPAVDFDLFYKAGTKTSNIYHAHLFTSKDEITLKIFYNYNSFFGEKFATWPSSIYLNKFGSYIKANISPTQTDSDLHKVDFSDTKLISVLSSSKYYENGNNYIIVLIDSVKLYFKKNEDKCNTGEFYLDNKGFRVIQPFYGIFTPKSFNKNEGKFEINRKKGFNKSYKLDKSKFRPEYYFYSKDRREDKTASIIKEPRLLFKYQQGITEDRAIFYGDVVLSLASFYYRVKIDYTHRKIYLPNTTIIIRNIEEPKLLDTHGNLFDFGINWDFNEYLKASCNNKTINNFTLLKKVITLFNQSLLVDNSSAFLIRYNIIEICDKQKNENKKKFKLALNTNLKKRKQENALAILLETISSEEHEEFKLRWDNVQTLLYTKPMKNQLISFFKSQNLDYENFPIAIKKLKRLRDDITHGSIDNVSQDELKTANIQLYKICGILTLNLMGIKDWKYVP